MHMRKSPEHSSKYTVIVRVSEVLKRTVVGDQQEFFSELH